MSPLPRLLTIMGSGETTPTMSRVHRSLLDRLGERPIPAVVLDTPYGFQENADDITARAIDYFRDSVGNPLGVASVRADTDAVGRAAAATRIREASYVFSGPGSPTYALRVWQGTEVPRLLAAKLVEGGAVTVASAAAVTVGRLAIPVYEVYKAGFEAHWLPGIDLLTPLGLPVAVVPHYDNAEGGNHDTRYCFMGERRLRKLEAELPDDVFILGVDGHTALILDLDARSASVVGQGSVTVRRHGTSHRIASGESLPIDAIAALAARGETEREASRATADLPPPDSPGTGEAFGGGRHPLVEEVAAAESAFASAMGAGDVRQAVAQTLALDGLILEWSRDTEESTVLDDARGILQSMVVRLGEAASQGARDPAERIRPFVDALVDLRLAARQRGDWAAADAIRSRLVAAGVELHDSPAGTTWELRPPD